MSVHYKIKSLGLLLATILLPGFAFASGGAPELPSFVSVFLDWKVNGEMIRETHLGHIVETWSQQIMLIFLVFLAVMGMLAVRKRIVSLTVPGKLQVCAEMLFGVISDFIGGILGDKKSRHIPVLATFLLFILMCNLSGLVPFLSAPTSKYQTTVTLALVIMIYYHYFSLELGVKNIVMHLLNNPDNFIMWLLSPLFFIINTIEIFTRPLSLSLRLFGNVMGKDILLGVFMILGVNMIATYIPGTWLGIPFHLPFLYLGLLLGVIQALVFTILSSIYLFLWTHHEEEHGEGEEHESKAAHQH